MVNWWMRATAKPGEMVKQIKLDSVVTPLLTSYTFIADTPAKATGELYGQVNTIRGVNGHSLGGYLSTAFTPLFGANVAEVTTMAAKIALKVDGRGDLFAKGRQIALEIDTADTEKRRPKAWA
ncbi:hypothetical protein HBDW_04010 [Herbaspirillum sp. DW155]|uniref:hypothetical protein n=1 Tax=Herbaspirillum sp. DW155 TaxID=3095609 RepID=UPI00308A5227|nr:hypothetical protein HBDW_04010 [Herbaspirillum sp. DW155]